MFKSDGYNNYNDGYFGEGYNINDNNPLGSVECQSNVTGMCQISQVFMDGMFANNEIKSVKFDPHEELVWAISSTGHLCGYFEYNLSKIVSVEVPEMNKRPNDDIYELLGLLMGDDGRERLLFILGRDEVLVYKKTGSLHERIKLANKQATCFSLHPLLVSSMVVGHETGLCLLDMERKSVVHELPLSQCGAMSLLRYSRGLLCGTDDGQILSIDTRDRASIVHSFKPHAHFLTDFTVNAEGYAVVSSGAYQCNQQLYTDQYLQVYDLRYKKSQFPIKAEMQPSFVRFMPVFNDSMLVASATGQYQIANFGQNLLGHPTDETLLLNEYDSIKAVDISSNSKLIAFGTGGGLISLTAANSNCCDNMLKINAVSADTVFPTVQPYMSMDPVPFDDARFVISSVEFAMEPLDKSRFSRLSSDWPEELCSSRYRKIKPVDMNLFSQYQSKFKAELIGRKPANWGPVWFPY